MDYLRVLLVPFRPSTFLLVGVFALLISFFLGMSKLIGMMGLVAIIGLILLNLWVLKYCFVLIESLANGAAEPPVMDLDTLSPFERRPWSQAALLAAGGALCWKVGAPAGIALAALLVLLIPAQTALIAMGDNVFQAMNPLSWWRVIRGMGPWYALQLVALTIVVGINALLAKLSLWTPVQVGVFLLCELGYFGLIGSSIWIRRRQLGFEPSRSPEKTAEREESARIKERAKMLDRTFEQARTGKFVDATAPLAQWLRDLDAEYAVRDSLHVAEQTLKWQLPLALSPIGSTLIRHLLRFGRPDAALSIFEMFRKRSAQFTMDSAADLRILAEYAEGVGKDELASTMRLETRVVHPSG